MPRWRYHDDPALKPGDIVMTMRSYAPTFWHRRRCELALAVRNLAEWIHPARPVRKIKRGA